MGPQRILIIDDEPSLARTLGLILGRKFVVVTETNARIALGRVEGGEAFDGIVCDLMMPEMTGMDVFDALVKIGSPLSARTLFITGGVFSERAQAFLDGVPNPRIQKPFDPNELLALVTTLVASSAA